MITKPVKTSIFVGITVIASFLVYFFLGHDVVYAGCPSGYYCLGTTRVDIAEGCFPEERWNGTRCYTDWNRTTESCNAACSLWYIDKECQNNGGEPVDGVCPVIWYGRATNCCVIDDRCTCSSWVDGNCGGGSCTSTQRRQTRNCNPDLCDPETRCIADPSCNPPTCSVSLAPSTASITQGTNVSYTATVTVGNGSVDQVNFSSSETSIVTVSPTSDASVPYQTVGNALAVGNSIITSNVVMSGSVRCTDTATIDVTVPGPWWQVQDADIITNGNLFSLIPATTCLLPGCDPAFGLEGSGGYPGVPSYGESYDFEMGNGTGTVSSTGWLANSMTTLNKVYDYSYFEGLVRPDVEINEIIEPEIQGGYLINQGNATRGYVWFKRQGDLTITGTANLQDRKVVLLIDGDLYLGRPPAQSGSKIQVRDGSGFFMAIVSGDIIISPKASIDPLDPKPVFEGIFLAEGQVKTGTEGPELDEQLWIRGSVAAYGGVVLERDLTDNSVTPAEFFEYGPDLLFTFPRDLTSRRYKWKEIAP